MIVLGIIALVVLGLIGLGVYFYLKVVGDVSRGG